MHCALTSGILTLLLLTDSGSSDSKEHLTLRQADATPACVLDKKILAKQRYREKNRKAQARHRERNKVGSFFQSRSYKHQPPPQSPS